MSYGFERQAAQLSAKIDILNEWMMKDLATKADVAELTAAVSLLSKPATPEPTGDISCEIRVTNSANPDQVHIYHGKLDANQMNPTYMPNCTYDGETTADVDVEKFIEKFERQIEAEGGGPSQKVARLVTCLKGDALQWFHQVAKNPSAEMKWQELRDNLLKRFQDPREEADKHVALAGRKQQCNESAEDYLKDKIELFYKAMPFGRVDTLIRFAELGLSVHADRYGDIVLGSDGKTLRYVQKSLEESWIVTPK